MKLKIYHSLIVVCILLSLVELVPYGITILFPHLSYGSTSIGKFHQQLNADYQLTYFTWMAYLILFMYVIYISFYFKNKVLTWVSILICVFMIYVATMPLLNIITLLLSLVYDTPPFIHDYHTIFPAAVQIEKKSDTIMEEFHRYVSQHTPSCIRETNPGYKIEITHNKDHCWRALHLKKLGKIDKSMAPHFPTTIDLLKDPQIHNAFFSILDPGVEIPPHVGYYKGYLRYHLGVVIPNDHTGRSDDKAYIVCGGEKYVWKQHEGIVFDDLYLHHVKNPTNQRRVVLYLDIKRKGNSFVNLLNEMGIFLIEHSILLNVFVKNQHQQQKIKN
jgi:aspartyl/asparaginyl beta-hydroxylase (cupin superfamily)